MVTFFISKARTLCRSNFLARKHPVKANLNWKCQELNLKSRSASSEFYQLNYIPFFIRKTTRTFTAISLQDLSLLCLPIPSLGF